MQIRLLVALMARRLNRVRLDFRHFFFVSRNLGWG